MEAELQALRKAIDDEKEARRREEHGLQVDLWRQREALNKQMKERIKAAKTVRPPLSIPRPLGLASRPPCR